ncbi:potassium channel family protein [Halalkalibacter kiskunsagensis]|uniref:Potassium channel family protein n=1 Tax=Halalkalibacter kiskunsagensis TaxID=1548599 RepID=A0ABV6KI89_9BACI
MVLSLIKKVLQKSISISHWKLMIMGVLFIIISSFIIYLLEPNEYKNPLNGFWFVMTTISQVGFGDYIPKTTIGRLYTVILYLVGVGFFAIIVTKWVDLLNNYEELKEEEILGYTGKNHLVMINWSQKAKITIEEILERNENVDIVLLDQLHNPPMKNNHFHYVQGNATKTEALKRANVLDAQSICIFAPEFTVDEMAGDGKTLLIASTIKQLAEKEKGNIYIIVEILDEDHIKNTNLDCVDEYILSNKPFSHLMAKTALHTNFDYT